MEEIVETEAVPQVPEEETESVEQPEGEVSEDGHEDHQPDPEEETEEVEHEGKRYAIPKSLKGALMMHADYTRKTQEIAELKRAIDADRARHSQASDEYIAARAEMVSLDKSLEEYKKINWNQLVDEDPTTAQKLWLQFSSLKDSREQLTKQVSQREHEQAIERQRIHAKLVEDGHAVLKREIPDWSPEKGAKITEFAVKGFGFKPEELGNIFDPRIVKVLHAAYMYDQISRKAKGTTPTPKPEPVKPVKAVSTGKAPINKDPSKMTDKEFAEWRRRQIKQRT